MKKLIGILMIMFITTGVFGQRNVNNVSEVKSTPTLNNTTEDWILRDGFDKSKIIWDDKGYGRFDFMLDVHFILNDYFYILAYEPMEDKGFRGNLCRGLFLYKKNINDNKNPWVKASARLLTNCVSDGFYDEIATELAEKSYGSVGKVEIEDNRHVKITVGWSTSDILRNDHKTMKVVFEFVPNNNTGNYLFDYLRENQIRLN